MDNEQFKLTTDDRHAVDIAKNTARSFLRFPNIRPREIIGLGNALYALERLPKVTPGVFCEFGIVSRSESQGYGGMSYITFSIYSHSFEISRGGSEYGPASGSDSYSRPGWLIELGGYRETECELYDIENSIDEYLNLGAEISVSDDSAIEYE